MSIVSFAQEFKRSTSTETLKQQTMIFKQDYEEDQTISLVLWGQSTGLGATLEILDMTQSSKAKEITMQYEIINYSSLYLLVQGEKFMHVVFRNDYAYIYFAESEEYWMKIPRTM